MRCRRPAGDRLKFLPITTTSIARPRWLPMLLCPVQLCALAAADGPPPAKPVANSIREAYREDAEECEFSLADGQKLELAKDPVMRWSNYGEWSGDVFVWTQEGRPAVIGCVLSWPSRGQRGVSHEFHLLAEKPIAPAILYGGRRWAPATGLQREPVADAPRPAASSSARLLQMRNIARNFAAYMEHGGRWELRLLPQPVMRYGDGKGNVVDGALFCYVWTKGTDPEVLLLLECRRQDDVLSWHYAPVLFTTREVWLKQDDREVWHAEPHEEPASRTSTKIYTVLSSVHTIADRKPETEKAEAK